MEKNREALCFIASTSTLRLINKFKTNLKLKLLDLWSQHLRKEETNIKKPIEKC